MLERAEISCLSVNPDVKCVSVPSSSQFRNPFDVPRLKLLEQLVKMRKNLSHLISDSSIPVLEGGFPGTKLKIQNAGKSLESVDFGILN